MHRGLGRFIQVIVFLFAVFGGFLSAAAPPAQTNPQYAVGFSSFLALIILIAVSAIAKGSRVKNLWRWWVGAGIFFFILALASGLIYPQTLGKLTYLYPPPPETPVGYHIAGLEKTQTAKDFIRDNPGSDSPGELELNLPYESIWTPESVANAKILLLTNYIILVLSISTAVFCFLEANLKGKPAPAEDSGSPARNDRQPASDQKPEQKAVRNPTSPKQPRKRRGGS